MNILLHCGDKVVCNVVIFRGYMSKVNDPCACGVYWWWRWGGCTGCCMVVSCCNVSVAHSFDWACGGVVCDE